MSEEPGVKPIPMILDCPMCHFKHVDEGEFATKPHHTHACQGPKCGLVWRPAIVPTVGVEYLPDFKNAPEPDEKDACSSDRSRAQEAVRRLEAHVITRNAQVEGLTRAARFLERRAAVRAARLGEGEAGDGLLGGSLGGSRRRGGPHGGVRSGQDERSSRAGRVAEFLDQIGDAVVGESVHDAADVVRAMHHRLQRIRDFVRGVSADDSTQAMLLLRRWWLKAQECKATKATTEEAYDVEEWMELERAMRTLMLRTPSSMSLVVRAREESNTFLHRLSKAVGTPSYDKAEWRALERCIFQPIKNVFTMAYS